VATVIALIHLPSEHWTLRQIGACCVLAVVSAVIFLFVWVDLTAHDEPPSERPEVR